MPQFVDKAKNYVTEKLANMRKPEASLSKLGLMGVNSEGVEYFADITVDNPYSYSIPICEISYVLKSDARMIASGTIPDPGSIKGNAETVVKVTVKVPHSAVVSLVRDIARDWDVDYSLDVGLIIDLPVIGNFTIPLSISGEVKLPTISDFFNK